MFPVPTAALTDNTQRCYEILGYWLDGPGFDPRRDLCCSPTRPDRLWDPPILLYNGYRGSFQGLKRPGREVNHPPPSSAAVKNEWRCTSAPPIFFNVVDRENFTFFLLRTVTSVNVMCKFCGSILGFESNYRFQYVLITWQF
jgi:hypothetical protein